MQLALALEREAVARILPFKVLVEPVARQIVGTEQLGGSSQPRDGACRCLDAHRGR